MNIKDRIRILRAQQTATTTTPIAQPTTIELASLPGVRQDLFNTKPDSFNDMKKIVLILNKYLQALSQNAITFNIVWSNPSISGSEFSNSLKNLISISKWIFSVLTNKNTKIYTIQGLRQIATDLMNSVKQYSFPDSAATGAQSELTTAAQLMITKLI